MLTGGVIQLFANDWGKEKEIIETYSPQKIILTAAAIDSLLNQPLTIHDCVAIALTNNVQLQIDRLEYNRVYFSKKGTTQAYLPTLDLHGERIRTLDRDTLAGADEMFNDQVNIELSERMPLGGSIRFAHRLTRTSNEADPFIDSPSPIWTISFTQPILKGFGYSIAYSDVKLANLDFQTEQYRLKEVILNTIFLVKAAYFEILGRKQAIASTEAAIERDQKLKEVSQAKVEAKLATRRDVLSAEIILQQDFAELLDARNDYHDALDILKDEMGIDIQRDIHLAVDELDFEPLEIEEERWIGIALENNVSIKLQEALLRRAAFFTKLTGNSRLPDLTLEGSYSRSDGGYLFREERSNQLLGRVTLSYPLFNYNARAEHQRAWLEEKKRERVEEDVRREILRRIRSISRTLVKTTERIRILIKNIEAAREKITFATTMFNLGRASNLDVTDAQKDLLQAEVDYAVELAEYYIEQARLEELLGGHSIINLKP
jgi:outer membrane protein TolC